MSTHLKAQLLRFARVSALAFVTGLMATGGHIGWSALWSLAAGALETGLRQVFQTAPLPVVTSERPPGGTP